MTSKNNRLQLSIDGSTRIPILGIMKKLITISIIAVLIGCKDTPKETVNPVETVDHKSISGSIKFTLQRDVNHIGKSTLNKIIEEELNNTATRINERLLKSGLPNGRLYFKKD